jgi:hypothetical protein
MKFTDEQLGLLAIFSSNSGGGILGVSSVNGQTGDVNLTKTDIGLSNVDNTSDLNKPISTATQTALDLKANATDINNALLNKQDIVTTAVNSNIAIFNATGQIQDSNYNALNLPLSTVQKLALSKINYQDYYIDPVNGDDIENNGSLNFPYKTFAKLKQVINGVPYIVIHLLSSEINEPIDFSSVAGIEAVIFQGTASNTTFGGTVLKQQILLGNNILSIGFENIHFYLTNDFIVNYATSGIANFIHSSSRVISYNNCLFDYENGFNPTNTKDINNNIIPLVCFYKQELTSNSYIKLEACRIIADIFATAFVLGDPVSTQNGILQIFPLSDEVANLYNTNHHQNWLIKPEAKIAYTPNNVYLEFASGFKVSINSASISTAGIISSASYKKMLYANSSIDVGNNGFGLYEEYFVNNFLNEIFNIPPYITKLLVKPSLDNCIVYLPDFENDSNFTSEDHGGDEIEISNNTPAGKSYKVMTGTIRKIKKLEDGSLHDALEYTKGQNDVFRWNDLYKVWEV